MAAATANYHVAASNAYAPELIAYADASTAFGVDQIQAEQKSSYISLIAASQVVPFVKIQDRRVKFIFLFDPDEQVVSPRTQIFSFSVELIQSTPRE